MPLDKTPKIVLGLLYGDEGKGRTVDFLCRNSQDPLVIRFSGGAQASHQVVSTDGKRHLFSSFGSGTFFGAPTFWSKFCTFSPIEFINEYKALIDLGISPKIYVDPLCPVITPYDTFFNRALEESRSNGAHGSCGIGFGTAIGRHTTTPFKLYVQDLFFSHLLENKLKSIESYYNKIIESGPISVKNQYALFDLGSSLSKFNDSIKEIIADDILDVVPEKLFFQDNKDKTFIFEGSQGILLDMDFGIFPHVTRSNTTSKNAMKMIRTNKLKLPDMYYVTRAYQTRHGNGPLSNQNLKLDVIENPNETNKYNRWQGSFRKSILDLNLIKYSLICDYQFSGSARTKNLVITCLDQLNGELQYTSDGYLFTDLMIDPIKRFDTIYLSSTDDPNKINGFKEINKEELKNEISIIIKKVSDLSEQEF